MNYVLLSNGALNMDSRMGDNWAKNKKHAKRMINCWVFLLMPKAIFLIMDSLLIAPDSCFLIIDQ